MCGHNTTVVKYDQGNVQVEVCTWGCGQTIISVKRADAVTESFTTAELSALRERVAGLEDIKAKAAIVIEGFELMSKASEYDLDTLKESLRKYEELGE